MNSRKDVKFIVITGGGSGLGRETALLANKIGYGVVVVGRNPKKLQQTLDLINDRTGVEFSIAVDLADEDAVINRFSELFNSIGQPVALINCAAQWMGRNTFIKSTNQWLRDSLDMNLFSAINASRAVLQSWSKNKKELAIINVGATSSLSGRAGVMAFALGKVGLRTFSQSLAREMSKEGVHVCHLIIDGLLDNDRTRSISSDYPDENFMSQIAVAKTIIALVEQDKTAWTFELDIRNKNESF